MEYCSFAIFSHYLFKAHFADAESKLEWSALPAPAAPESNGSAVQAENENWAQALLQDPIELKSDTSLN